MTTNVGIEPLEQLLAVKHVGDVKARYFRTIDTRDWEGFAEVFASDAVADYSDGATNGPSGVTMIPRGRDEIVSVIKGLVHTEWGEVITAHHGHMAEIEVTSRSTARGIFAMEDRVWFPEGAPTRTLHGWGHYHDTFKVVDGRWVIEKLELTRLHVVTTPW